MGLEDRPLPLVRDGRGDVQVNSFPTKRSVRRAQWPRLWTIPPPPPSAVPGSMACNPPAPLHPRRRKLYVAAAKRAVLGCIDLAPEYRALLTTDHLATNMHAVGGGKATSLGCGPRHPGRRPGWSAARSRRTVRPLKPEQQGVPARRLPCAWPPPACPPPPPPAARQVPMRQVTLEAMEALLLRYKGRYTTVVRRRGWGGKGGIALDRDKAGKGADSRSACSYLCFPGRQQLCAEVCSPSQQPHCTCGAQPYGRPSTHPPAHHPPLPGGLLPHRLEPGAHVQGPQQARPPQPARHGGALPGQPR